MAENFKWGFSRIIVCALLIISSLIMSKGHSVFQLFSKDWKYVFTLYIFEKKLKPQSFAAKKNGAKVHDACNQKTWQSVVYGWF